MELLESLLNCVLEHRRTLALEMQNAKVTALDIDEQALSVTQKNAKQLGADINCIQADILTADKLPQHYDIIVSNPPYITEKEKTLMHKRQRCNHAFITQVQVIGTDLVGEQDAFVEHHAGRQ